MISDFVTGEWPCNEYGFRQQKVGYKGDWKQKIGKFTGLNARIEPIIERMALKIIIIHTFCKKVDKHFLYTFF